MVKELLLLDGEGFIQIINRSLLLSLAFTFRFAFTHVSEEQSTMLRDVTLTVSSKKLEPYRVS